MSNEIILAILGSSGLFSVITLIINLTMAKVDRMRNDETAQKALLVAIAHDRIIHLCKEPLKRGFITDEEHTNIATIGDAYIKAGGNHLAKKYLEEVEKLPINND